MIALQESRELVAVTIPDGMTKQGSIRYKVYLGVQLIGKIFSKNKGFYYAMPTSNYAQVGKTFITKEFAIDWLVDRHYGAISNSTEKIISFDRCLESKNYLVQDFPIKERKSQRSERFTVDYREQRIGRIARIESDTRQAIAPLEYGAFENKSETRNLAANWQVLNSLKVAQSQIKFEISENLAHCNIECGYILVKIDSIDEEYRATIQDGNILNFEDFPDLIRAVAFSFDLILNPTETNFNYDPEF